MLLLLRKNGYRFCLKGNLFFNQNCIIKIKKYDPLESAEAYKVLSFCVTPITFNLSFMFNHPH